MRPTTITMGWGRCDANDVETDYTLKVEVTFPSPGRGPSYASGGDPPDPGEVLVLEVRDEAGALHPELLDEAQDALDCAEAMERAEERVAGEWEDECERREDARRERWAEERAERLNDTLVDIARR